MNENVSVAIVGVGRLGASLADGLMRAGYRVTHLAGRDLITTGVVARTLRDHVEVCTPSEAVRAADLVFLAVPDDAIEELSGSLPWRAGQWVVHCSGASGLEVLSAASEAGAVVGCFHPLQSFPSRQPDAARFRGITVGIEAQEPLSGVLEAIARDMGARPVRLEGVDRALYHASAVFASNDVVALMAAAARTWALAGLPYASAREALAPLMLGAARNVAALELAEALTGPIARGDTMTIERHLEVLARSPELQALYRALARVLLAMPLGRSDETRARLAALLDDAVEGQNHG
ncbi:DUF2520 domain-containing protein [bacterium]|nr:DUF2520 domain-containing protein [bacterium]